MKMLLNVTMPHEPFNEMTRKGTIGKTLEQILGEIKPEAAYFSLNNGKRHAVLVLNVDKPGDYVRYAEPFFLKFNADIKYDIVITPEEIRNSGLEAIGKKYA
jgi:hypothetical protein